MINIIEKHRKLSLSNFKGRYLQCPNCGKLRLKPYAYENGQIENEKLGRCQREVNCGYHLKPSEYFKDKGENYQNTVSFAPIVQKSMHMLDKTICQKFIANHKASTLFQFLQQTGIDFVRVFERYKVGASSSGNTIFFQFDSSVFRSGKAIKYLSNGHRDKSARPPVVWLHKKLGNFDEEKEEIRQCFFGRHLINDSDVVCVVESEKTALICAGIFPDAVWMATGGRTQLSGIGLSELSRKKVLLFPDTDSLVCWSEKTKNFGDFKVHDLSGFDEHKKQGSDIADYILEGSEKIRRDLYLMVSKLIKEAKG
jgi:hypothetical protein